MLCALPQVSHHRRLTIWPGQAKPYPNRASLGNASKPSRGTRWRVVHRWPGPAISVPHMQLGEQDGPLCPVHVAVCARTLHDRARERELDYVKVGDVEPLHELARLLKELGYSFGS